MNKIICIFVGGLVLAGCSHWPGSSFPRSVKALEQVAPKTREINIEKWQTEQGATVMYMQANEIPMLEVRLLFDAGSARDGALPGLARVTSAMIGEATGNKDVNDITLHFEKLGAEFSTGSYRDMAIVELTSLSAPAYLQPALAMLNELLSDPVFPVSSLARVRAEMLEQLKMKKERPGPQLADQWAPLLFGDHPYAINGGGTEASLAAIGTDQVSRFYQRYYNSSNLVIAIVGDVSPEQAQVIAATISDALPQGEPPQTLARVARHTERKRVHVEFPSAQTSIIVGNQAIWRGHPDFIPLYVGNMILGGGGFASILTEEVRQKRGLVYGIHSDFAVSRYAGQFEVGLRTANDNADQALSLVLKLVTDFVEQGPDEAQVQAAIDNITGSFALATASNGALVSYLGMMGFYDLPLDYLDWFQQQVAQTTASEIHDAFQRNLEPAHLLIGTAGPREPQIVPLSPKVNPGVSAQHD